MHDPLAEQVYDTLRGVLIEEERMPGVENLFEEGSFCMTQYGRMYEAYQRLCDRLQVQDEDADVEEIIHAFMDMERALSMKMYEWGRKLADRSSDLAATTGQSWDK